MFAVGMETFHPLGFTLLLKVFNQFDFFASLISNEFCEKKQTYLVSIATC